MKNTFKFLLGFILLIPFSVRADGGPIVHFNKDTSIMYLTDEDKQQVMEMYNLNYYDGDVIVITDNRIDYLVDYSHLEEPYETEDLYDQIINSEEVFDFNTDYVCEASGKIEDEYSVSEIRRVDNKLSFGNMYGIDDYYASCIRRNDHNMQNWQDSYVFDNEGFKLVSLYYSEDNKLYKMFIYYVKDIENSKLNFKSSKVVKNFEVSGYYDFENEINKDVKVAYTFEPQYYEFLIEKNKISVNNLMNLDEDYDEMILIDKDGFDFKIDFDKSTFTKEEISGIDVVYYSVGSYEDGLFFRGQSFDEYKYAFGKQLLKDGNEYSFGNNIEDGIVIKGMNDTDMTDWEEVNNSLVEVNLPANLVLVNVRTIDETRFQYFAYVYDDETNLELLNTLGEEKEEEYILGDMNNDGSIGLTDIIYLIKRYLRLEQKTEDDILRGDINGDGRIGIMDIIMLLRTYLGL